MYITINYPHDEDLEVIEGAEIIEWIDDNTVALEIDFNDLMCHFQHETSLEHHGAEGATFVATLQHATRFGCKWGCHHVLNEEDVEQKIVDLYVAGEL